MSVNTTNGASENGTKDEGDLQSIQELLEKLGLDQKFSTEDKLNAVCIILKKTADENARIREESSNLTFQLEKNEQTKTALQNLCEALKTQVQLTKDEASLKIKEETAKRIEVSNTFESTMKDLKELMNTHSSQNGALRDENKLMADKVTELLGQFEAREKKLEGLREEYNLQIQLYEAKLAKAKIERAEVSADFTQERLELHKQILEYRELNEKLVFRESSLQDQLEMYKKQLEEFEKGMGESGVNLTHFRKEMDRLTGKLRKMEIDTGEWKRKFENANEQVRKMNEASLSREREFEILQKKLMAMEKLNRALNKERTELMQKLKKK